MDYMDKTSYIVGIDEAGRGPVAGPVSVGIFAMKRNSILRQRSKKLKLKDSKQLSPHAREEWMKEIELWKNQGKCNYVVMFGSAQSVDKKGIAVVIRMLIEKGLKQLKISEDSLLYLDGSLRAPECYVRQKTIIKGDEKIRVISLASVCAKVARDKYMKKISKKYPKYEFWKHKGYGTIGHMRKIKKHGLSKEHRTTFLSTVKIDKI